MLKPMLRIILIIIGVLTILIHSADAQIYSISGTVTDPNAVPVDSVNIFLYDQFGDPIGIPPIMTNITGYYIISGLPAGIYGVGYVPLCKSGLLETLEPSISVNSNVTVNVTLPFATALTGQVVDSLGFGILDIDLNVYDQATGIKVTTCSDNTDIDGFYDVFIPAGIYRLRWSSAIGERWVPVEIENVVISNDTAINITMELGYFVSGIIQNQSAVPIYDVDLDFIDANSGLKLPTPNDHSDINGFYQVTLPAGIFNIEVEPQVIDKLVALEIPNVTISNDTTINFTLPPGLSLSGYVRDSSGIGVPETDIDVRYNSSGVKLLTPYDDTDSTGHYEVIVPSGTFDIAYDPPVASLLAPVEYVGVTITNDMVLDAVVADGILITGLVQNIGAQGVPEVDIDAEDAVTGIPILLTGDRTDITGSFAMIITPGLYHFEIEPPDSQRLASEKLYNIQISQDTSFLVTLDTGIMISGSVTDSVGVPVADVCINPIYISNGDTAFYPTNKTDIAGNYQILIRSDTYNLHYIPDTLSGLNDSVILNNVPIVNDTVINVAFSTGLPACCVGIRGNIDGDINQNVDIADLVYFVNYSFGTPPGPPPPCFNEADIDNTGTIDIADIVYMVNYMFGTPPGPSPLGCP